VQSITIHAEEAADRIYFAAGKQAAQTITVGGADAALVTQHTSGTVDGSAAGVTESVFAVSLTHDMVFETNGGRAVFTLTVDDSDAEKASKTINVTLKVTPHLTGMAVYKVERGAGVKHDNLPLTATPAESEAWARAGTLKRISGIKKWQLAATWNGAGQFLPDSTGDDLLSALAWVDHNIQDNEEYIVRVEKDEQLPCVYLMAEKSKENVKFRLRGGGGDEERNIGFNAQKSSSDNPFMYAANNTTTGLTAYLGIFNVGMAASASGTTKQIILSLENNITIQGQVADTKFRSVIQILANSRLILEAGSKITGYDASNYASGALVYIHNPSNATTRFIMRGGSITGNTAYNTTSNSIFIAFSGSTGNSRFIKNGGIIDGNFDKDGNPCNIVKFSTTNIRAVDSNPAVTYDLP
jgi:hypothetical protein